MTEMMLRVEGLDGTGNRLYDYERVVVLREDGETFSILLTLTEAVRTGVFLHFADVSTRA